MIPILTVSMKLPDFSHKLVWEVQAPKFYYFDGLPLSGFYFWTWTLVPGLSNFLEKTKAFLLKSNLGMDVLL